MGQQKQQLLERAFGPAGGVLSANHGPKGAAQFFWGFLSGLVPKHAVAIGILGPAPTGLPWEKCLHAGPAPGLDIFLAVF